MLTINFTKVDSEEIDSNEKSFHLLECQYIPLFAQPIEIGHFSIDSNRKIHFNKSQLKYLISSLKTKDLNLDLDINFESDTKINYVVLNKLYQMLYWLKHHKDDLKYLSPSSTQMSKVDFVTVRGTLARIICTPYISGHFRDQWEICASKFNGVVYFSAVDSDVDLEEEKNATKRQRQFQAWGYKFEQYVTTGEVDGDPDITNSNHQLEEFCIVLKNVFNEHTLLYKAEVDAAVKGRHPPPGSGNTSCYIELKTSRIIQTQNQMMSFLKYAGS